MPQRAASPAGSEFELDISAALADQEFLSDDDENGVHKPNSSFNTKDIIDALEESDGDEAFIAARQAASNRKGGTNLKGKQVKKGGGFQTMGLNLTLLKAITRKGFSVPTPIQRKTIPLVLEGIDVVGMARTGSGKTAAFVIPMIEKLKTHSVKVGARAIIMSPSRELALQTLKVVKELGKGTDLKCVLLVGGDSLEDQFSFMAGNPDIIIATPGRFLHLKVEMNLDLRSIQYVVFDEADRLFEMGFSAQLSEILHALPPSRQSLLFSATLPKSLVEFAKAGLQEPTLIRLDADSKISFELESAFFSIKSSEKEGALLHLLQDVIKIPLHEMSPRPEETELNPGKKRKRSESEKKSSYEPPSSFSTIVFAATKHHVEYLARLISLAGYPVSYVYGSLDQVARRNQVSRFRAGETKILVVTDVAARGIDIPVLANVINYDFPPQPKIFVHRVGRTARAGRRGWSYSLVRAEDTPYLIDLQLFLGRKLVFATGGVKARKDFDFAADVIVGGLIRDRVERCVESVNKILSEDAEVEALRGVAVKGERLYQKTRPSASTESVKRAKEVVSQKGWSTVNPLFADDANTAEIERVAMLARVSNFRPPETIFEIGQRGLKKSEAAVVMKRRREKIKIDPRKTRGGGVTIDPSPIIRSGHTTNTNDESEDDNDSLEFGNDTEINMDSASEADLTSTFSAALSKPHKNPRNNFSFQDSTHFMSYTPTTTSLAEDRGYSISGPSNNFIEAARTATMDLTNDDSGKGFAEAHKAKGTRWDKKAKKFVQRANDEDGSRGKKMIIGESGQKIAASFQSGRFDRWKSAHKLDRLPRVGELESASSNNNNNITTGGGGAPGARGRNGRMFHKSIKAPKPADRARDDYHVRKKRVLEAKEKGVGSAGGKTELKSREQIGRERREKERRREKSNLPGKRRKVGGGRK